MSVATAARQAPDPGARRWPHSGDRDGRRRPTGADPLRCDAERPHRGSGLSQTYGSNAEIEPTDGATAMTFFLVGNPAAQAGQAPPPTTIPLTVFDGCGPDHPWSTFFGGGAAALQSTASVADAQVTEGNAGNTVVTFTVTLSVPSARPVTVGYRTADGTARAGQDYVAADGTVTFSPGETSKTIAVQVRGNFAREPDKTFTITLSDPVERRHRAGPGDRQDRGRRQLADARVTTPTRPPWGRPSTSGLALARRPACSPTTRPPARTPRSSRSAASAPGRRHLQCGRRDGEPRERRQPPGQCRRLVLVHLAEHVHRRVQLPLPRHQCGRQRRGDGGHRRALLPERGGRPGLQRVRLDAQLQIVAAHGLLANDGRGTPPGRFSASAVGARAAASTGTQAGQDGSSATAGC